MPTQSTTPNKNLTKIFTQLKKVLTPYSKEFDIADNDATAYNLVGTSKNKNAKRFGGVAIRKNHVTFYSCPILLAENASPELKAKMTGTSSVNFDENDQALIDELASITAIRYNNYLLNGWL